MLENLFPSCSGGRARAALFMRRGFVGLAFLFHVSGKIAAQLKQFHPEKLAETKVAGELEGA